MTGLFRRMLAALLYTCALLTFAASVSAQGTTGQLTGTVADPNGAVVQGATVTVRNRDTGLERQATTGDDGTFAVQLLPPGLYRVSVSGSGFSEAVVEEVRVQITETATVNISLAVAGGSSTVTVTADPPTVQLESSQVGRVIDERAISQLPLPTRNFQQLLTLSPGTYASVANNTELGRGDVTVSVNGQRTTSNNIRINGIDANSVGTNSTPNLAVPATDSLQEFIVQTSTYDASTGRNAGGNVEAVTKSGSNDFHGNIYEFFRNEKLNANDFFLNTAGRPRPIFRRNQFGGTIGGPIVREKFFFFGSYQGTRERNGASLNNSLTFPIIDPRLTDNNRTAAGLATAFGLTPAQISPVSLALLQARLASGQFVIPSAATASGLTPISGVSRFTENQFNLNLDYTLSQKHTLSGKGFFASNPTEQSNYNFAGLGNGNQQLPGFGGSLDIIQTLISVTDTYVFSPNVVNQARLGFSRLRVTSVPEEPITAASLGITTPFGATYPGLPTIFVTGQFSLGSSPLADQSSRINMIKSRAKIMKIHVGDTAELSKTITDEDIRVFADLTGDHNPVHLDDSYASNTRFKRRVAHGMLTASLISSVLANKLPGEGTVYLSQTLKFVAPVYLDDTVTARVTVTDIREDKPIATLETVCLNQRGETLVKGEAVVFFEN